MSEKEPEVFSVDAELEKAQIRIAAFEEAIQSGDADAADDVLAQRRAALDQAKKLLKYRSDVQQTAARADGRRVLWRILEIAGPNRISHTVGDPYHTAFLEGKRAVANELLLMLFDADPDVYAKMQREHLSDLKSEQESRKKALEESHA